ncbi:hypothetical protein [Liquorilactobacillus uvarum]|uniref:hypothetical protein n=1 Tax=Liquorilactobacillus uvarum TaxID=303240 RepID=UPI00288B43A3|nr:hypothetical protein [Liquorilactobacillus uvarum]
MKNDKRYGLISCGRDAWQYKHVDQERRKEMMKEKHLKLKQVAMTEAEKAKVINVIKKLDMEKDAKYVASKAIINAPTLTIGIPE